MGAYGLLFKDRPDRGLHYRDLRSLQDDRTVLRNPHKGWYWHYIDNGYGRDNYRKLHDPADMLEDFPGLNHLYLRFDWGDIEKEEGVLDWSYIDEIMDKWGKAGYRFSFRVCTYEASNEGSLAFATPKWVFDAGAKYRVCGGAYEPDYGDPVFLEKLGAFMEAYGKKFNGHPLVETVDIGTFGTWGEGHTSNGSELVWPLSVMKKHIDLHAAYFPDTYLLLNDDYINHRNECGDEENLRLMDYALQRGTGLCDDSVCVEYYSRHCGYDTLRTPFMFDYFWKQAPVDLEFEQYAGMKPEDVDYINAHGTSTHHNDLFETKAIKLALGDHAYKTRINSTKSMVGHLLGAAGGVEFITCVKSIQEGFVHATAGLEKDDPECDLDYCKGEGVQMDVNCAISNSLGFGGHNATLLVKKFEA